LKSIRTFVAIELDEALRAVLADVQAQLKKGTMSHTARWVSPRSIHLTLEFLGDVSAGRIEEIEGAIRRACVSGEAFSVSLTGTGCFPDTRRPRVVWVGVGGDVETLVRLQHSVESELGHIGFSAERRRFHPHLTLARMRRNARPQECAEFGEFISTARVDESVSMVVREVSLMRSDLRPSGAVYTCLAAIPLGDELCGGR